MKIYFLTFAAPLNEYAPALERIIEQAKEFNLFYKIIIENEYTLKNYHKDFWDNHKDFIENNKRGYGYWLWKPYLIKKVLSIMNNDDILLYCDVGCELNHRAINKFYQLLNIVKVKNIIGYSAGSNDMNFTKRDLSIQYDLNYKLLSIPQLQAGCLLIKKCDLTYNIINEWFAKCEIYKNIDDSPSVTNNFEIFVEHRHDQSVLNMILKKYKIINHYFCDILSCNSKNLLLNPILYIRNKTGKSKLK